MCEPKLGARGIRQCLDCIVGLAVGLQKVEQDLASHAEVEHLAWREVASNVSTHGKRLQHATSPAMSQLVKDIDACI